ncbi:hypothetical protein [Pseudomonas helleri]|uniref:hypothetical protein n=1 Tax=Pseudomonas helleri TaxID=1608996 RepID=UPI003FD5B5EE
MNLKDIIASWKSKIILWINNNIVLGITIDAKIASILFYSKRSDYYMFLADTISGTRGRKSLVDIFKSDAERYGKSARGKLSIHWIKKFQSGGGNLQKTFAGTLPADDVAVLDTLLRSGGERALENALRDLAENSELLAKAKAIMLLTTLAGVVCLAMTLGVFIAMPAYTIPKIVDAFSMLPLSEYPSNAKSLVELADFVKNSSAMLVIGAISIVLLIFFSLSYVTGKPRYYLDKYGFVWGLYRDFQSIRFLSTLAALVRENDNTAVNLKLALEMQLEGASRWKKYHLNKILSYVRRGKVGPEIFATGIMDKTMEWYISDLIESRGFSDALQFVKERLKDRVLKRITVQSVIVAWVLTLSSIAISAYLLAWHMKAIDELRHALQLYLN